MHFAFMYNKNMNAILTGIFVIIRIFSNSLSNVFQKKLTSKGEIPMCVNFINYLILAIFSLPLILLTKNTELLSGFWTFALLGGICGALCNYFMVEALKFGELSVLGPINSYKAIVGLIFGMILLGEIPDMRALGGVLLIFTGSFFIFETINLIEIFKKKDIQFRFLALFFAAIEAIFIKKVILLSSVGVSFIASSILGAVFSFAILKLNRVEFKIPQKRNFKYYLLTAICFGLMTYTTATVFKRIQVGYALSLFQLSVLVNVFLGWGIFKEKHLLKKLTGSIIIILGAIIIILS